MLKLAGAARASNRWVLHACAVVALILATPVVLANNLQEASQLLRSGQHQQALERINKILAAKPADLEEGIKFYRAKD